MKQFLSFSAFILFFICTKAQNINWQWAGSISGSQIQRANAMAVDDSGNVFIAGVFSGTADFDPGPGVYSLTSSSGYGCMFICKLNNAGEFVWAETIDGNGNNNLRSIQLDAKANLYAVGNFFDTVDFDPGPGMHTLISNASNSDIFILKIDSAGNLNWVKTIGNQMYEYSTSVAVDDSGNAYVAGNFSDTVDFDPGSAVSSLTSHGGYDIFIAKYDSSGNYLWADNFGGISDDAIESITIDSLHNVYSTGGFIDSVDFDAGPLNSFLVANNSVSDAFILKLSSSGSFKWVRQLATTAFDKGYYITTSPGGNIYTFGNTTGTIDLDPGPAVSNFITSNVYTCILDTAGLFVGGIPFGGAAIVFDPLSSGDWYIAGEFANTLDLDFGTGTYNLTDSGNGDIFVSKYNNSGVLLSAVTIGGGREDHTCAMIASKTGAIYLAGTFYSLSVSFGSVVLNNASIGLDGDAYIARIGQATTGINNTEFNTPTLSPNPAQDLISITIQNDELETADIYEMNGSIILSNLLEGQQQMILSTKNIPNGIYVIRIKTKKSFFCKRLIIQK
jgi:hypothetical protein